VFPVKMVGRMLDLPPEISASFFEAYKLLGLLIKVEWSLIQKKRERSLPHLSSSPLTVDAADFPIDLIIKTMDFTILSLSLLVFTSS
jgi:hypothetical protein